MAHWSNEDVTIKFFPLGVEEMQPVWRWLNEIVQLAEQADPPPPNIDLIIYLAFKCCADCHPEPGDKPDAAHKIALRAAVTAARQFQWSIVAFELDHDV